MKRLVLTVLVVLSLAAAANANIPRHDSRHGDGYIRAGCGRRYGNGEEHRDRLGAHAPRLLPTAVTQ